MIPGFANVENEKKENIIFGMSAISLNYICLFLNYKIVCFEVLCIIVLSNAFSYQTDYWTFRSYPEKTPNISFRTALFICYNKKIAA